MTGTDRDRDVGRLCKAPPQKADFLMGTATDVAQSPTTKGKFPGGHYHGLRSRAALSSPTIEGSNSWWASPSTTTSGRDQSPITGSNAMWAPPMAAMSGG